MSKVLKNMLMDDLRSKLGDVQDLLVIDSSKVDAVSDNRMRIAFHESNIQALTIRNKLALRVFHDSGINTLDDILAGPSTIVWGCEDIVQLSKEIAKWAKELEPLEIKGGTLDGNSLSSADVEALSKSPSREELISQIVGLALSPGSMISGALLGMGGKLASQVESIADGEE